MGGSGDAKNEWAGGHLGIDPRVLRHEGNARELAFSGELQKAKLLGARRTLQKPINLDELLRAIQYELQH